MYKIFIEVLTFIYPSPALAKVISLFLKIWVFPNAKNSDSEALLKASGYFLLLFGIIGMSIEAQVAPKLKVRQIYLEYKSPIKSLEIKDTSLIISERKDTFDNPVSSIPSSSKTEERNYTLSRKEVYDLMKLIQDTKFFELGNSYGAPEAERSYPTRIFAKMHGNEKEVVYRSNPAFNSAPEAFSKIESYLLKLRK